MGKKYKEMSAKASLSPQVLLGDLIRRVQAQRSQTTTGTWIKIKPNEIKPKQ